ncbi:hypothetical protein HOLleu_40433 [Holothuria leucospilota]|uniref:EF-hand domain-containing protein n=1 Tax=Holothuria leucospilota TaxID=206669 RepID=A0A9Q0YE89_HOLLE|nr:hypothetical protein HOLleu_40433 [Holothuria leucospilota]
MTLCSVFRILAILAAISEVINACGKQSSENKNLEEEINTFRKTRELNAPILVGESAFGVLLRPHNTKVESKDVEAENLFRRMDRNGNDEIDAAEWVDFSKETSVWDFVKLLDYADLDDDEAVSLEEFLAVQIVKIDRSEEVKNDVSVTPS